MPASTQHQTNTLDLTQKQKDINKHRSSYNPSPTMMLNQTLINTFGIKKKLGSKNIIPVASTKQRINSS